MCGLFQLINHLAAKYADPKGNAEAQKNFREVYTSLGMMYEHGQGVPQNYIMAHMWFNLAASRATDTATRDQAAQELQSHGRRDDARSDRRGATAGAPVEAEVRA